MINRTDSVGYIMRSTERHPLLTKDQEQQLGKAVQRWIIPLEAGKLVPKRIEEQGIAAKQKLMASNVRLVIHVAQRFNNKCQVPYEDLIQSGCVGLGRAAEKFDPTRDIRFSTYAWQWIRQAISRHVDNTDSNMRLPVHVSEIYRKIRRLQEKNPDITLQELAERTGKTQERIEEVLQAKKLILSLDYIKHDNDDVDCHNWAIADPEDTPNYNVEAADAIEQIRSIIRRYADRLEPVEMKILSQKRGLHGKAPVSAETLATRNNMQLGQVKTVERRAMKKLRDLIQRDPDAQRIMEDL